MEERTHLGSGPITVDDPLCPVAAGLAALGDATSVLLVRDLLWHGPQSALRLGSRHPHVTRHDVVERLEALRRHDLVERHADPGIDPVYRLTHVGRSVEPVIGALYRFGLPVLRHEPLSAETIGQLVTDAARNRLDDLIRLETFAVVGLEISGRRMSVVLAPGIMRADAEIEPDVTVVCTHDAFTELVTGVVSVDDAVRQGAIDVHGAIQPVRMLFDLLRPGHRRRSRH